MSDAIDYPGMVLRALRSVPREALALVAERGLPDEHHFYLTFRTTHPGVVVPRHLRDAYPETMTIVLQHQFWNLDVEDDAFSVTLRFGGAPADLVVPFDALTEFADPAASFGIKLEAPRQPPPETATDDDVPAEDVGDAAEPAGAEPANVVSMDRFRKKRPPE